MIADRLGLFRQHRICRREIPIASTGNIRRASARQDDFRLTLLNYWRMFYKRKWLILAITTAFVILGGVRTLMETPLYTATVRLQIDRNVAKVVEGGNVMPTEGADFEFFRTQYELLQSRTMAERVVSALRLGDDENFFEPRNFPFLDP